MVNPAVAQQVTVIRGSDFGQHNQVFLDDSLWFFYPGELPGGKQAITTTAGWDTLGSAAHNCTANSKASLAMPRRTDPDRSPAVRT